jgi:hypothetical protein
VRREFDLLAEDKEYLDGLGLPWETVYSNGFNWVLIHKYPLPNFYNLAEVSIGIEIAVGYPRTQLDMVYFFPALSRKDGHAIGALSDRSVDGKNWQRWSRHRTQSNPWREGVDNLSTHMACVEFWLEREFKLRPCAISI